MLSTVIGFARVHTIHFGTHYGLNYVPNSLIVNLGDTVRFSGTFDILPLKSDILPAGAISFQNDTGLYYIYVPNVIGTHNYHCTSDSTMIGSFYVQSTVGIDEQSSLANQVYFNGVQNTWVLSFAENEVPEIAIYNEAGELIKYVKNVIYEEINPNSLKKGLYLLQIRKKDSILAKRIFIN